MHWESQDQKVRAEMKTVYTAIFGPYDDLKAPFFKSQSWRYICFTDQDIKSDVWEIVNVPLINNDPAKTARYYKINFHKHIETEFSMWIDATFFINIDLNRWWRRFQLPMTVINHPFDNCVYTDLKSCIGAGKGDFFTLIKQVQDYRNEGLPENNGLISSGILMRQNAKEVQRFCELWWKQVERYTQRDQPGFGYAAWKMPGVFNSFNWNYTVATEFIHIPHLHKPWREEKKNQILKKYGVRSK